MMCRCYALTHIQAPGKFYWNGEMAGEGVEIKWWALKKTRIEKFDSNGEKRTVGRLEFFWY